MNRVEFMQQLERFLSDIPESERLDAIAYYNDYFDEAGAVTSGVEGLVLVGVGGITFALGVLFTILFVWCDSSGFRRCSGGPLI